RIGRARRRARAAFLQRRCDAHNRAMLIRRSRRDVALTSCHGENTMKTRAFKTRNATQLVFSAIGLGTAPLGEIYEVLDEKTSIATVEQAIASGVRIFDTSPHYGNGIAESRMGAGLRRAKRSDFIVSTKIGRVMDPFAKPPPRNKDVYSPGFVGGY